jgi:hypothetical protein
VHVPYFSHILTKLQSAPGPHHHHRRAPPPISDGAAPRTKRTLLDLSPKSTHLFAWNFLFFRPILGLVGLGCLRPSSSLLSSTYWGKIKKHIIVFIITYIQGPLSNSTLPVPRFAGSPPTIVSPTTPVSLVDPFSVCSVTPCPRCIAAFRILPK